MKYTIEMARERGINAFESQTLLVTDEASCFLRTWNQMVSTLAQNNQLIATHLSRGDKFTRLRNEYDMFGEYREARKEKKE